MIHILHSTARARSLARLEKIRSGVWVHVVEPSPQELALIAEDYGLDEDLLKDAVDIYEAPRVEADGKTVYIYTRYCYPEGAEIATEPLLIVHTEQFILTLVRRESNIVDRLLSDKIDVVTTQKTKLLLQILGEINRSYRLQLNAVSKRILQIRAQVRQGDMSNKDFVSSIELEEDLNEFLSALQPQSAMLNSLTSGKYLRLYEEDRDLVEDMHLGETELIELMNSRLKTLVNIRQAYDAIATNNLNKTFKRLTSIAIFLTIPTIAGGLWGMNVALPFATHPQAFWIVLLIILAASSMAVYVFHRKKWL